MMMDAGVLGRLGGFDECFEGGGMDGMWFAGYIGDGTGWALLSFFFIFGG